MATLKGSLSAKGLGVTIKQQVLLQGVELVVPSGQLTMILGPNGAGKSTLLRCLAGLQRPTTGWVGFHSEGRAQAWSEVRVEHRARLLAWCPAEFSLPFAYRLIDVVRLARFPHQNRAFSAAFAGHEPKAPAYESEQSLLSELGLTAKQASLVTELSSGEKRRLMIARALAQQTPLVLLDEPCANLDMAASLRLLSYLRRLCDEGLTVCACLHDMMLAKRFAQHAVLLNAGQVKASGPAEQVLVPHHLNDAFGLQVRFHPTPDGELIGLTL